MYKGTFSKFSSISVRDAAANYTHELKSEKPYYSYKGKATIIYTHSIIVRVYIN